jgi:hypothetical protein
MNMRITPLALPLCLICLVVGCDRKDKSGAAAPPGQTAGAAEGTTSRTYKGVTFAYPKDWVVEESTDPVGLYVRPPARDEPWQTNLFLEVRPDPVDRPLAVALDDAATNVSTSKVDFQLKSKSVLTHPAGFQYGRLEYTNTSSGVPLTQWELIVPMDKGNRLYLQASSAMETWSKYEPDFQKVIDSIRLAKAGQ